MFHKRIYIFQNLYNLAALVRGELPKLTRSILCALITIDVHARDIVTGMVHAKVMAIPCILYIYYKGTTLCDDSVSSGMLWGFLLLFWYP